MGGRGVLHQGDLTYAVVTSHIPGNLDQVYRTICQFLIEGWKSLGVELQFGQPDRQVFEIAKTALALPPMPIWSIPRATSSSGSAQLKQGKYTLQHGAMLLRPDPDLFQRVFHCPPPDPVHRQGGAISDLIHFGHRQSADCRCRGLFPLPFCRTSP